MTSAIIERTASDLPELHLLRSHEDEYQVVLRLDADVAATPEVFALGRAGLQQLSDQLQELADTYGGRAVRHTWCAQPWCTDLAPSLAVQRTGEGLVLHISVLQSGRPRRLKLALRGDQVGDVLRDLRRRLHHLGSRTACHPLHAEFDVRQDRCLAAMWLMG
jgi:hypothetical protein